MDANPPPEPSVDVGRRSLQLDESQARERLSRTVVDRRSAAGLETKCGIDVGELGKLVGKK